MPQTFFPSTSTSLTHLICAGRPESSSMVPATATAAQAVMRTASDKGEDGRYRTLMYRPLPSGE